MPWMSSGEEAPTQEPEFALLLPTRPRPAIALLPPRPHGIASEGEAVDHFYHSTFLRKAIDGECYPLCIAPLSTDVRDYTRTRGTLNQNNFFFYKLRIAANCGLT